MQPIKVLLADDHPGYIAGIQAEAAKESDIVVVGQASTGGEALQLTRALQPDVLVLDMQLPDMTGVEVMHLLRKENIEVMVLPLSGFTEAQYVMGVLDSGACGYMTKDERLTDIMAAIRKVSEGGIHISARVLQIILKQQHKKFKRQNQLTGAREKLRAAGITRPLLLVLKLVAEGYNNKEIGERLYRSEHTVRNHVERLRELLNLRWRPELVAWAWRNGIMQIENEEEKTP